MQGHNLTNETCDIDVRDHSEKDWESLHKLVKEDSKVLGKYPKVSNYLLVLGLNVHLTRVQGHQQFLLSFVQQL